MKMEKTVVIIGASRGLGLEFARQYSADGWQVIGTVRREADAVRLRECPQAEAMVLDVLSEKSYQEFAARLADQSIVPDVVIHNAGVNLDAQGTFTTTKFADWDRTFAANVTGAVGTARYLLPLMPESRGAKAVFITSELGSIERCNGGFLPYRASKAALNMLVKCLAVEQAKRGVLCIAMHPGWVKTDMGGPNAPLEAPDSIRRMRDAINRTAMSDTGAFLDLNGARLPY